MVFEYSRTFSNPSAEYQTEAGSTIRSQLLPGKINVGPSTVSFTWKFPAGPAEPVQIKAKTIKTTAAIKDRFGLRNPRV